MTKEAALYKFWSTFGIPAYEENSVPSGEDAPNFPYITYQVVLGSFNEIVTMNASIWYRSTSWLEINAKAQEVSAYIGRGGRTIPCNDGFVWITRGTPFAQNMADESDNLVKRKLLNIQAQFATLN